MIKIQGVVQIGLGEGRKVGYPTANLNYGDYNLKIENGVYAGWCYAGKKKYAAAVVVGAREHNPTLLEVHILNFNEDLVGKKINVEILDKVGNVEVCDSKNALKKKIAEDIKQISKLLIPNR